jgi:hypothetical protein
MNALATLALVAGLTVLAIGLIWIWGRLVPPDPPLQDIANYVPLRRSEWQNATPIPESDHDGYLHHHPNGREVWTPERGWHDGGSRVGSFLSAVSYLDHRDQCGDLTSSRWQESPSVSHPYRHVEDGHGPNRMPGLEPGYQWVKAVDLETGWPMYVHERCPGPTCHTDADTAGVNDRTHQTPWGYVSPA